MSRVGNRIFTKIDRPSKQLVESFKGIPVANIDDCMGRLAAVDPNIVRFNNENMLGVAFTVRVPAGDNLMFHKAMDLAEPGDVIVIDAGGGAERAILGELMASYCEKRGIAGLVVDGCVRDADILNELKIPVYASGVTPNGPYKNGPGEINVPVSIGGRVIFPGDIIVGDGDGVIAIRPADAEEVLQEALNVLEKENTILDTINNQGTYTRSWVDPKIKEIGTVIE